MQSRLILAALALMLLGSDLNGSPLEYRQALRTLEGSLVRVASTVDDPELRARIIRGAQAIPPLRNKLPAHMAQYKSAFFSALCEQTKAIQKALGENHKSKAIKLSSAIVEAIESQSSILDQSPLPLMSTIFPLKPVNVVVLKNGSQVSGCTIKGNSSLLGKREPSFYTWSQKSKQGSAVVHNVEVGRVLIWAEAPEGKVGMAEVLVSPAAESITIDIVLE